MLDWDFWRVGGEAFSVSWRVVNATLATLGLIGMFRAYRAMKHVFSERALRLTQAHQLFLLATAWGSVENLLVGNPVGTRTALATAAAAWTLWGLSRPHAFTREEEWRQ